MKTLQITINHIETQVALNRANLEQNKSLVSRLYIIQESLATLKTNSFEHKSARYRLEAEAMEIAKAVL